MAHLVEQPRTRSRLRRSVGRQTYILKRRVEWLHRGRTWAIPKPSTQLDHVVAEHQSIILRPLKNVDMYLQENKRTNLRLASEQLDGLVIEPGETFSFWKTVGRPSARRGYLEGFILNQGCIETEVGGGLCQLSNLLFWLFAHTPLDITERHRHGFDVFADQNRTIPFGGGATVAFNYIDLQVQNRTLQPFALNVWQDDVHLFGRVTGEWTPDRTFRVEERNHRIVHQSWGGYSRHNQIVQVAIDTDGAETEKLLVENHALMMYNPVLESG